MAYAVPMTISFVAGAVCSLLAGFSGMWVSIRCEYPHGIGGPHQPE